MSKKEKAYGPRDKMRYRSFTFSDSVPYPVSWYYTVPAVHVHVGTATVGIQGQAFIIVLALRLLFLIDACIFIIYHKFRKQTIKHYQSTTHARAKR